MTKGSLNKVLSNVQKQYTPDNESVVKLKRRLQEFVFLLERELKKEKINADVFIGGSFAKGTMIKKEKEEIDIFIRYPLNDEEISEKTDKVLQKISVDVKSVHGSRDYFQIPLENGTFFEVIPVKRIKNVKEAQNITDLSAFHVAYVKKALAKNKKLVGEIRLAKAFCHAQNVYGAESHIQGFSGYALELLVIQYKGFVKFLQAMIKAKDQVILFDKKQYKNKQILLMEVNSAKLVSPIVFVDPTCKDRNALAALSKETFEQFQDSARKFLKSPSTKHFEKQIVDFSSLERKAKSKRLEFVLVEIETDRQEGVIAGSKLLKFSKFLEQVISSKFKIVEKKFYYANGKTAQFGVSVKPLKKSLRRGPGAKDKKHVQAFRQEHKKAFLKKKRWYCEEIIEKNLKAFLENWKMKNYAQLQGMSVKDLRFV